MITFRVNDMTCSHCANTIARAISQVADQDAVIEINIQDRLVHVGGHAGEAELAEAIVEAGYHPEKLEAATPQPRPQGASGCCCSNRGKASVDTGQVRETAVTSCCT